jgi:hypothetical protein
MKKNFEKLVKIYATKIDKDGVETKNPKIQVLTNTNGKLYIKV